MGKNWVERVPGLSSQWACLRIRGGEGGGGGREASFIGVSVIAPHSPLCVPSTETLCPNTDTQPHIEVKWVFSRPPAFS